MAGTTAESVISAARDRDRFTSYELSMDGSKAGMALLFREYDYQRTDGIVAGTTNASMMLPLATNLIDSYSINIGQNEIGGLGMLAADVFSSGGGAGLLDMGNQAASNLQTFGADLAGGLTGGNFGSVVQNLSDARGYAALMGRNLMDSIPGGSDINAGIGLATGTAVNPHAALQFNGINLKSHNFEWKLSPKNRREADTIRNMANRIRSAALPSYANESSGALSRALLRYPNLVDIWFVGVQREYFYYFKPCMINNFSINYAPDGVVLNRGGIPNSVILTLQVTEARINTRDEVQ